MFKLYVATIMEGFTQMRKLALVIGFLLENLSNMTTYSTNSVVDIKKKKSKRGVYMSLYHHPN